MASIHQSRGEGFIICFRFGGKQFNRKLGTSCPKGAEARRKRVEATVHGPRPRTDLSCGRPQPKSAAPPQAGCYGDGFSRRRRGPSPPAAMPTVTAQNAAFCTPVTDVRQAAG
jgi:hypothetical protein